ncbi:MAG: hypothetical protein EBZ74_12415, partial [Planctomycetia bacterium]|nr:hypothetical protein [Planctomycetia bacterium]
MTNLTSPTILPGRTMATNFPSNPCAWCGTTPTAVYDRDSRMSACDACAASWKAQVAGVVRRLDALPPEQQQAVAPLVTADVQRLVGEALASPTDASQAARTVVPMLLGIVGAAKALAPAPVLQNRYPGKCTDCGQQVPAEAGRRERVDGAWIVRHLAGACPAPTVTTPTATLPIASGEAQRTIRTKRDGKCLSCGGKVLAGKGWAMQHLPDARGWAALHDDCADSLAADRAGLPQALRLLGDRVIAATGTDTRDHAVRLAVDFITGEGDGEQSTVFLRVCWGAQPTVETHHGAPGNVHRH